MFCGNRVSRSHTRRAHTTLRFFLAQGIWRSCHRDRSRVECCRGWRSCPPPEPPFFPRERRRGKCCWGWRQSGRRIGARWKRRDPNHSAIEIPRRSCPPPEPQFLREQRRGERRCEWRQAPAAEFPRKAATIPYPRGLHRHYVWNCCGRSIGAGWKKRSEPFSVRDPSAPSTLDKKPNRSPESSSLIRRNSRPVFLRGPFASTSKKDSTFLPETKANTHNKRLCIAFQ